MKFVKLLGAMMIALLGCACQVYGGCQTEEDKGFLLAGSCARQFINCLKTLEQTIGTKGQDDAKLRNGRADCIKNFDLIDTTKEYANCVSVQCGICDYLHKWYDLLWPRGLIARRLCHDRKKKHCHAVWG